MNGTDYLWAILQLVLILGLIAALAYGVIRLLATHRGRPTGPLDIIARVPLEPRRTLYLLKLGKRGVLIGSSDAGLQTLADLSPEELQDVLDDAPSTTEPFADKLSNRLEEPSA